MMPVTPQCPMRDLSHKREISHCRGVHSLALPPISAPLLKNNRPGDCRSLWGLAMTNPNVKTRRLTEEGTVVAEAISASKNANSVASQMHPQKELQTA